MEPDRPDDDPARDVLAAYRQLRVPANIRASAWDRLQVAIADPHADADAPHADAEPTLPTAAPRRRSAAWAVALLTAAALVLLIAGLRRMAGPSREGPDPQSALDSARHGEPSRTTSRSDDDAPPPPPPPPTPALDKDTPTPPPERRVTRPTDRPEQPAAEPIEAAPDTSLQAELTLLRAARAALTADDSAAALRLLGEHADKFPHGHLAEERMVLRAKALCEHGDRPRGREAIQQLLRAYPQSPNAATLTSRCQDP